MPGITKERLRKKDANSENTSSGRVVEMATPWKISAIQEGLGGKYDRGTIIEMLQQCRGNIDRAFCNLLDENDSGSSTPSTHEASASVSGPNKAMLKTHLQPSSTSRSSSPFSNSSKRSADDADGSDSEDPRPAQRRRRPVQGRERKRRILPDVTVGIAFRDDQNDLVSLRLRVSPEAVAKEASVSQTPESEGSSTDSSSSSTGERPSQQQPGENNGEQKLRRSRRLRNSSGAST